MTRSQHFSGTFLRLDLRLSFLPLFSNFARPLCYFISGSCTEFLQSEAFADCTNPIELQSHKILFSRRFGFANTEALARGETGTACRGEEHDITLVWSITSGKRLILADGKEVHYSSSRNGIFDFSWTMKGNNVLKVVAHASPPLSPTPGFRQYDFFVNGQSFFTFPKVFRIGLMPGDPRGHEPYSNTGRSGASRAQASPRRATSAGSNNIMNLEAPHNQDEVRTAFREIANLRLKDSNDMNSYEQEEAYLQEAIRQSLNDDKQSIRENCLS